jgi:general secretion pathway protein G
MMRIRRRRTGGFTLIELLLVVVIIGILAAIVVPKLAGRSEDARISAAKQQLATFRSVLGQYEMDTGKYPTSDQGLRALVVNPGIEQTSTRRWKGPYLDVQSAEVPKDPWGHDYVYVFPGAKNTSGYDLFSLGADGQSSTEDDVYP